MASSSPPKDQDIFGKELGLTGECFILVAVQLNKNYDKFNIL